ncbi:alpha/beta fold hydrolase [Spirillospora sp. NPDC048824]|uniref:alpha/beta fold hydrolase n=1 Tax=Spirillospora sp. NPDC048824 TaxID=3364526 RepID=UPI00371B6C1A
MTGERSGDAWLWDLRRRPRNPRATLVLLPHAGGSAQGYGEWAHWFPEDVRIVAAQYPGRGPRYGETPATRIEQLAQPLAEVLREIDGPLHIFGHSLGAHLGFEVCWRLKLLGRSAAAFYPSAAAAPHTLRPGRRHPGELDDATVLAQLRERGGLPDDVLGHPELLDMVIEACRTDMAVTYHYRYGPMRRLLDCPLLAFGGRSDVAVPAELVERWPELSTGPNEVHLLSGGHFYVHDHMPLVTAALRSWLGPRIPPGLPHRHRPDQHGQALRAPSVPRLTTSGAPTMPDDMVTLPIELAIGKPPIIPVPDLPDVVAATEWLTVHKRELRAQLLRHGHLLIRGLPITDADAFAALRDVLVDERAAYKEKATPRSNYGSDIFSSTDLPAAQPIHLHNENSYTLDFPGLLIFACIAAPSAGGATTVADVREVLQALPADLVQKFRATGWLLTRNYYRAAGLPWTTSFGTENREDVEAYCANQLIGCIWTGEDGLRTVQRRSAVVTHPVTGDEVWFNHAAFWSRWSLEEEVRDVLELTFGADGIPFDTAHGDGATLGEEEIRAINAAYAAASRRERWQPGDLMLVDNILSAHGRETFSGSRKILVAMGEPVLLADCSPTVEPAAAAATASH